MSIECHIGEDIADYSIEFYCDDFEKCEETNGWKKIGRTRLAYIAGFRSWQIDESEQVSNVLKIAEQLKELYSKHEDGEVQMKIVIKDCMINS